MKHLVTKILSDNLTDTLSASEIENLIEIPPSDDLGDFAFPCFSLSKIMRKSPAIIAKELCEKIAASDTLKSCGITAAVVGAYLNFFVDKKSLAEQTIRDSAKEDFGCPKTNERVVVEFASPNTNKPLHLGHLRNMSIGDSVSRILAFCGDTVSRTSINNDRGVHICKSMLAYKRCGNGATPESENIKSDHFVGDYYVLFNNKSSEDESWNTDAQAMLKEWEDGNAETVSLWKTMNGWALNGFRETYKLFGIAFDKEYYESDIYKNGKEIVYDGLERGIFEKREDGAVFIDLTAEKLDTKVLLRPDGTSVYIVQDLYLAILKNEEYNYDRSIYVVGNEQDYHFAVLIAIFEKLGLPIAEKMKHLSYGMVELPEGKMKSREGTVVDADDLIFETKELAKKEVIERYTLSDDAAETRALKIALAAIKYQLLKIDIAKNMIFDPKVAISFEGDTGPYLLYAYARASSIIRKANGVPSDLTIPNELNAHEIKLIKKIAFFPTAITFARNRLSPSVIAAYSFELAQIFNEFYHACPVLVDDGDTKNFRINLVSSFRSTLKKCLELLGIEAIEEM